VIEGEALRAAALDALGALGDARAREALEHAEIVVEAGVMRWEGTLGEVVGHRVIVLVDAAPLARVVTAPAAEDALRAALATAVARAPGQAMAAMRVTWRARREAATVYRGRVETAERAAVPLAAAFADFIGATGEGELAAIAARARIDASAEAITMRVKESDRAWIAAEPSRVRALAACARALLARSDDDAPRVHVSAA